jgi:N-acetylmuramoyl-L-alanine amidase
VIRALSGLRRTTLTDVAVRSRRTAVCVLAATIVTVCVGVAVTAANGGGPARALTDLQGAGGGATAAPATAPHSAQLPLRGKQATLRVVQLPLRGKRPPPRVRQLPPRARRLPLSGKVVGIDPGHNGGNFTDPASIAWQVWNGREWENCDTTGTETNGGYTEALFNFRVAEYLRADLIREGARVVMTRTANSGVGPCVDRRASIINGGHANVAVDIHADGAASWGRGFAILEPVADGPNNNVIGSSARLGADIRAAMLAGTQMPTSNYDGYDGIKYRDDLAGLNLTNVPKILIEVGNMQNATDAAMLTSATFQLQVAGALLAAIIKFLR